MAWTLEFSDPARKAFRKLAPSDADRITKALAEIAELNDPTSRGHALVGNLRGLWRYRVTDWRVIARLEKQRLVILVVEIGHAAKSIAEADHVPVAASVQNFAPSDPNFVASSAIASKEVLESLRIPAASPS